MTEVEFAKQIEKLDGRLYLVGGYIRDMLLKIPSYDKDYLVVGIDEEDFINHFHNLKKVGKSFPVFLINLEGKDFEVALARKEKKVSTGYKGFVMIFNKDITLEEDLFRRDITINAMAMDVLTHEIIDIYGGILDIEYKILRPISEHFLEDPIRSLRIARFSAKFNFKVDSLAFRYMKQMANEFKNEPPERIFREMEKALSYTYPPNFFETLKKGNLLDVIFPAIFPKHFLKKESYSFDLFFKQAMENLKNISQISKAPKIRFALLICDAYNFKQKNIDNKTILVDYELEEKAKFLNAIKDNLALSKNWFLTLEFILEYHQKIFALTNEDILTFLKKMAKLNLDLNEFIKVLQIYHKFLPWYIIYYNDIIKELNKISTKDIPPNKKGKEIGQWIKNKELKTIIDFQNKLITR